MRNSTSRFGFAAGAGLLLLAAGMSSASAQTTKVGGVTGNAAAGKQEYRRYCIGCHGKDGDGAGENAQWIDPKPRDFTKKISRNTKQLALRKAMTERLKAGDVVLVDDLKLGSNKTKDFLGVLKALELKGTALVVSQGTDKNLTLASRNVATVALATSDSLNTYDVLRPDKLVFTRNAFEQLEARLTKE